MRAKSSLLSFVRSSRIEQFYEHTSDSWCMWCAPPALGPTAGIPGAKMELILIGTITLFQHHSWGRVHIVHSRVTVRCEVDDSTINGASLRSLFAIYTGLLREKLLKLHHHLQKAVQRAYLIFTGQLLFCSC